MTPQELHLLRENGIDAETALGLLMNKEHIYRKYLCRFAEDKNYVHLQEAVEKEDPDAAFRAVHTLKGTAAVIGAMKISQIADSLTEQLRPIRSEISDLAFLRQETDLLGREITKVNNAIEKIKNLSE